MIRLERRGVGPDDSEGARLTHDARAAAFHEFLHLFLCRHGSVARSGGRKGAVGRAVFHGLLRVIELEETELHSGSEAVATADSIEPKPVTITTSGRCGSVAECSRSLRPSPSGSRRSSSIRSN